MIILNEAEKSLIKFKPVHNKSPQKIKNQLENLQSDKGQLQKPTSNIIRYSEILDTFSLKLGTRKKYHFCSTSYSETEHAS